MYSGLLDFINSRSLLNVKVEKNENIVDIIANNYRNYTIESPLMPILTMSGSLMEIYFPSHYIYMTKKDNEKLIKYTQGLINKGLKEKPDKVIIDLRGNVGGDFTVFYSALYALLPSTKTIITGTDMETDVAKIEFEKNNMTIHFRGREIFSKKIKTVKKSFYYDSPDPPPIYVRINDKSMSSSQLIAIMFIQEFGRDHVLGSAPAKYTNGSLVDPSFADNVVYPGYIFKDRLGNIYNNGIL